MYLGSERRDGPTSSAWRLTKWLSPAVAAILATYDLRLSDWLRRNWNRLVRAYGGSRSRFREYKATRDIAPPDVITLIDSPVAL